MTKNNSVNRWRFVVGVGIAAAIVGWFVVGLGREAPEAESRAEAALPVGSSASPRGPAPQPTAATNATLSDSGSDPVGPAPLAAPDVRIADGGRLSIDADSLREGEVLAIGLGLADEARGEEPVTVRIVSVDGRHRETTAAPARGSGSGLRLEIDPEWLTPGRYMIEVSTAEKTHFPVRRYVLEVR
jgi:hypothetical protein